MAKPKASPTAQPLADKVGKKTRQGNGLRSKPNHELIRVSITRENRTISTFVTSHHLVEDKRRQLLAHFERA